MLAVMLPAMAVVSGSSLVCPRLSLVIVLSRQREEHEQVT